METLKVTGGGLGGIETLFCAVVTTASHHRVLDARRPTVYDICDSILKK